LQCIAGFDIGIVGAGVGAASGEGEGGDDLNIEEAEGGSRE
jgi:hypothetical protein